MSNNKQTSTEGPAITIEDLPKKNPKMVPKLEKRFVILGNRACYKTIGGFPVGIE